jgi:hypothetical protein
MDILDQYLYRSPSISGNTAKHSIVFIDSDGINIITDNKIEVLHHHGVEAKNNGKNSLPTFNIKR